VNPVEWKDGRVRILDQRELPDREAWLECDSPEDVRMAIRDLAVRGAPAIGIAAGYGMALAARTSVAATIGQLEIEVEKVGERLRATRPTAVNLARAVERVVAAARSAADVDAAGWAAETEAVAIAAEEDRAMRRIARFGEPLIPAGAQVLTHCNTGALACGGGDGTAQGVIAAAHRSGKGIHVWVDETRPVLQGARLTTWELRRLGIPLTLVADTAAGYLMAAGRVDVVIVGADRVAANGDVANKIGTYPLAVLADANDIPFYVAVPVSTIDPTTPSGDGIVIEMRDPDEVIAPMGHRVAPKGTPAENPAFDVTPGRFVTAFITDRGVIGPPFASGLGLAGDAVAEEAAR
jgi:methylthioribose-1-phosphate isomerase